MIWVIKMDLNWKLNKTEHIVQDEWIDFRKESFILPDGKEFSPFYNYSRRNFVVIIARTKDDKYITVKQFRHGLKKITTEFLEVKEYSEDEINDLIKNNKFVQPIHLMGWLMVKKGV